MIYLRLNFRDLSKATDKNGHESTHFRSGFMKNFIKVNCEKCNKIFFGRRRKLATNGGPAAVFFKDTKTWGN